jgi:hypothetical protein
MNGGCGFHRPITVGGTQIGVADTGGLQFHQGFTVAGVGKSRSQTSSGAPNSVTTAARMVSVVVWDAAGMSRV